MGPSIIEGYSTPGGNWGVLRERCITVSDMVGRALIFVFLKLLKYTTFLISTIPARSGFNTIVRLLVVS